MASAVVLLGMVAWFALDDLRGFLGRLRPADPALPQIELQIEGMTCNGCVRKVEGALQQIEGVSSVMVTRDPGRAVVSGTAPASALQVAVRDVGFQVVT